MMIDYKKLIKQNEGQVLEPDMIPWFLLAKEAGKYQDNVDYIDNEIKRVKQELARLLRDKIDMQKRQRIIESSMNKVLPEGSGVVV